MVIWQPTRLRIINVTNSKFFCGSCQSPLDEDANSHYVIIFQLRSFLGGVQKGHLFPQRYFFSPQTCCHLPPGNVNGGAGQPPPASFTLLPPVCSWRQHHASRRRSQPASWRQVAGLTRTHPRVCSSSFLNQLSYVARRNDACLNSYRPTTLV